MGAVVVGCVGGLLSFPTIGVFSHPCCEDGKRGKEEQRYPRDLIRVRENMLFMLFAVIVGAFLVLVEGQVPRVSLPGVAPHSFEKGDEVSKTLRYKFWVRLQGSVDDQRTP